MNLNIMRDIPITVPQYFCPWIYDDLIRLGRKNDGGYLIPLHCALATDNLISLGLGFDWTFESDFARLHQDFYSRRSGRKISIIGFDHTIGLSKFLKVMIVGVVKSMITKITLEEMKNRVVTVFSYIYFWHYKSFKIKHKKIMADKINLRQVLDSTTGKTTGLKIDIEGDEWYLDLLSVHQLPDVTFLILEIHNCHEHRVDLERFCSFMEKTHKIAHFHINNNRQPIDGYPQVVEITWVNKSFQSSNKKRDSLPIPILDYPCHAGKGDYKISFR